MTVTFTLSFKQFRRLTLFVLKERYGKGMRLALIIGLVAMLVLYYIPQFIESQQNIWESMIVRWVMFVGLALAIFFPFFNSRLKRVYRSSKIWSSEITYTFGDQGIETQTIHSHGEVDYQVMQRIVETAQEFFLFLGESQAYIVPKTSMQADEIENLSKHLQGVAQQFQLPYQMK